MEDIPVGEYPVFIAVNEFTNMIYVANDVSNTISVINGTANNNTKLREDIQVQENLSTYLLG
jgi:DNA-binding beta-propeller fold protein YncE